MEAEKLGYLPIKRSELSGGSVDFIMITGDAYVDHPSFGHAIIARLIESFGYSVAIIAQPVKDSHYLEFGLPDKAFLVTSGVVDSMVNNWTAAKKKRTDDVYSPGGKNTRPDRALTVYCRKIRELFGYEPAVIIGGMEASLRRLAHYDYWADKVLPSILKDTEADILVCGMGEKPVMDMMKQCGRGVPLKSLRNISGTAYMDSFENLPRVVQNNIVSGDCVVLPGFEQVAADKKSYVKAFRQAYMNTDHINGKMLAQKHGDKYVIINKPQEPLSTEQMDHVYALPFMRNYHPSYETQGGVKAIEEVKFSITSQRGCFGSCSFCALTYHQGRRISHRSLDSIVSEAKTLTELPGFKGYIHDIGGPTANFYNPSCEQQKKNGVCRDRQCIGAEPCPNLKVDHREYLKILQTVRTLPGIKKVFIRSGIRFDYIMLDPDEQFLNELIKYHISGQLKVAPEHTEDKVLKIMNKPKFSVYKSFREKFTAVNKRLNKEQYIVPYLISSHPGSDMEAAENMTEYLKSIDYMPIQVQDFYPTPATKSTVMYYTGINPDTMQPVYIAKGEEKKAQRRLIQWRKSTR